MAENGENASPATSITPKPADLPIPSTAALEFEEFSFIGPDGHASSEHVQPEHMEALNRYLLKNYDVQVNNLLGIFIVLFCGDNMPLESERPFSIAGCIAIWKTMADLNDGYDLCPFFGRVGSAPAEPLDSTILSHVEDGRISNEVLLYLADKVFTDCEAISVLGQTLVIELPEVSDEDFGKRLKTLPRAITNLPCKLEFRTRALIQEPWGRYRHRTVFIS